MLQREERPGEVHVEHPGPLVDRGVDDRAEPAHPGARHGAVDAVEVLRRVGDQALHVGFPPDVDLDRDARVAELVLGPAEALDVDVPEDDPGAVGHQPSRGGEPDAGGAAGDDQHPPVEPCVVAHVCLPAVVGPRDRSGGPTGGA